MEFLASLGKMIVIVVLLVISATGLLGFLYALLKTLGPRQRYEEKKKYAIAGGAFTFLSCLGLSVVALIRQPILELAPILLFISLAVAGLATQSIISPAWLANYWRKRAKRKDR